MAEKTKFEWLGDATFVAQGIKLEKGQTYDITSIGEEIVEEWARTGHAKIVTGGKKRAGNAPGGEED